MCGIDWPGEPVVNHEDIHRSYEAPDKKYGKPQQHKHYDGTAVHWLDVLFYPDEKTIRSSLSFAQCGSAAPANRSACQAFLLVLWEAF
jgi:hypothetical protein